MKWNQILLAVFLAWIVPWGMLLTAEEFLKHRGWDLVQVETEPLEFTQPGEPGETQTLSVPVLQDDGSIGQMALEEYLTCVVLAEMPADFEAEALKAQAVVARTYCLKLTTTGFKHESGAVCTDSTCCQAFCLPEDYLREGGKESAVEKVRNAVQKTQGQVLTYDGALIEATYFSCSGGMTEDAAAVWGTDIPYLQAVSSPGEEGATHYVDTVSFSTSQFAKTIGCDRENLSIGSITYTEGGGVNTIQIGDEEYSGTELRQLLGLRSTAFVITNLEDSVIITTKGFGHRVGMSQYGADAMAVQGSDYTEILAHYYPGTTLELWHA